MISWERLAADFAALRACSLDGEGVTRLAFGDEDWRARDFAMRLMSEAGLTVRTDAFGNVFGRREGTSPEAAPIMLGSHLDSVPQGGNFDGAVGVLGAIEVARHLNEIGFRGACPVDVAVFMAEESSRFGAATLGSKAFCGKLAAGDFDRFADTDGVTLREALARRGLDAARVVHGAKPRLKAFFELHIEQGKVLECEEKTIGLVTGIAAPTRLRVVLRGNADHSGATPMGLRADGLCAAAEVVLAVERLATASKEPVVGTVGALKVSPGVMNVIPGLVELGIDIRSISADAKQAVARNVRRAIAEIAGRRELPYEIAALADDAPVRLDAGLLDLTERAAREAGCAYLRMPSGAGHDAMHLAEVAPTAMLFIPCRGGISHNPAEYASIEDIVAGADVLARAVMASSSTY